MNKDLLYIFDKKSPYARQELGEIQSGFNMSLVIDGTKDSQKVLVLSYNGDEIEPNTICWHGKTNTWWIVSHDKVERHLNDGGTFIYHHSLQLEGATELLNARDLTDCGFNQGEYTIYQFIKRLFSLSNFEFELIFSGVNYDFREIKVDFVKTFENYTLLSALRELLDGYNMCPKLSFAQLNVGSGVYRLNYATLTILSKTGNNDLPTHDISEFDDVKEIKSVDKNSFGTTVVSNAENVISGQAKTYPSTGGVKLSSTEYLVSGDWILHSPVIRLPSKVFKGNWIKVVHFVKVTLISTGSVSHSFDFEYQGTIVSFNKMINYFVSKIRQDTGRQDIINQFLSSVDETKWKHNLDLISKTTLYNCGGINPETGEIVKADDAPYLTKMYFNSTLKPVVFTDKETRECLPDTKQGIAWERGSNLITGFDMFSGGGTLSTYNTDYGARSLVLFNFQDNENTISITAYVSQILKDEYIGHGQLAQQISKLSFIINYIPMTDLKVKVDNAQDKKDVQLYNQNGKITDNFALSKLLNSYSKEISSNNITRYMQYRDFDDVPQVGSFVTTPNGDYIVNNVSLDFSQNEKSNDDFGYYIEAEITMSKYCAVKSLNVSPNTNIRDYGIPQNFNVKRKQLYRDYYELSYNADTSADTQYYLNPSQVFDLGDRPNTNYDFVCVIKLGYDEQVEGQSHWYYQLETTVYQMNKMVYVVCDFNDNNIIGYSSQNVYSGFDITRVFSGSTDGLNTPISYVDGKGKVKSINIKYCTIDQLATIYDYYQSIQQGGDTYEGSLYNYSCFIPMEIYEGLGVNDYSMLISEPNYKKDAIEVPVFEYGCQIEDSDDVLIGDNIFPSQKENVVYMYSYRKGEHLNQNNSLPNKHITYNENNNTATLQNAVKFNIVDNNLNVRLLGERYYYTDDMAFGEYDSVAFEQNKDYAIFRHTFDLSTNQETNVELVMVLKKVQPISLNTLVQLVINHWKLN